MQAEGSCGQTNEQAVSSVKTDTFTTVEGKESLYSR